MRWRGETLASAAERITAQIAAAAPVHSHFVTLAGQVKAFYSETEQQSNEENRIAGGEYAVYSVPTPESDNEHPAPLARIMPVTHAPPFKIIGKASEPTKITEAATQPFDISMQPRQKLMSPEKLREHEDRAPMEISPVQHPIEARKSRKIDWEDGSDEGTASRNKAQRVPPSQDSAPSVDINPKMATQPNKTEATKTKGGGRQSELSAQSEKGTVVNKVLDTLITLPLRDLLANSRELSITAYAMRHDDPMVASTFIARNRGFLIEMLLECGGRTISAIIDTGSQLNIVREDIAHSVIRKPIDLSHHITVNDANGGEGILQGLVSDVLFASREYGVNRRKSKGHIPRIRGPGKHGWEVRTFGV
ncbi:hypothetical protein B0H10DRAFT_1975668 [Mycena sp. CBHHK59/15]|nr:hypothetical protein B0H10DRAFT_1975668 [Mycena sp. CBHHK59/15]